MGKEVMRGKTLGRRGTFGESIIFRLGDCIGAFGRDIFFGDWKTVLRVLAGEDCGRTVTRGHLLLGVLGSGARNPYRILELGSRRGSVPSWLGGKGSVLGSSKQSATTERKGHTPPSRGIFLVLILLRMKVMI
jgi:hypothetical protein